ncbi:hypothetical protein [Oleiagrimonas sp. C23AA]|uniref:hypothetical protein n=1 Tax=Oleiagrimonas sp. C23AA TaxID=2719047 RepID=UPI00141EE9D9|nr:hypothetical protein [Oleiagrimonas sp. C23AA]NII12022.1 hypothetical protein [Oleiagrimonas sp. C23AA]
MSRFWMITMLTALALTMACASRAKPPVAASSTATPQPSLSSLLDQGAHSAERADGQATEGEEAQSPRFKFKDSTRDRARQRQTDPAALGRMMPPQHANATPQSCAENPHQPQC